MKTVRHIMAVAAATLLFLLYPVCSEAGNRKGRTAETDTVTVSDTTDFYSAHKAYSDGNLMLAKDLFMELAGRENGSGAPYFYLANIAIYENNITDAEFLLDKAIKAEPENYWYRIKLAQLYIATDETDKAIAIYEDIKKDKPKKYEIYTALIELYLKKGDADNSMRLLDEIETVSGVNEATALTRLNILAGTGKMNEAYEYAIKAGSEIPSARILTIEGDLHAERYKETEAIECYNRAIELDPAYAPAYYGKAEVFRLTQKYDDYFSNINRFLKFDGISTQMKISYMNSLLQNQAFLKMFMPRIDSMVMNILSVNPADTLAGRYASSYFVSTARYEKGVEIAKKEVENNPDNIGSIYQLLSIFYYSNDWGNLFIESAKALSKYPESGDFLQLNAISAWQLGDTGRAIMQYEKLLPIATEKRDTSGMVSAYASLGDMHMEAGNSKKAYSNYKKALRLDPDNYMVLNNYAYFMAIENKNLKNAYRMSKKVIDANPDNPTYLDTFAWILHLMGRDTEAKSILKHAMLYGGKDMAELLDHYAEILYSLKEYDTAFMYWMQADIKDPSMGIREKAELRKQEMKKQ